MTAATPKPGDSAPAFALPDKNGDAVKLEQYTGRWVVLYFYPRDNTPGCTREACGFSERLKEFERLDAVVLGVSGDSEPSHRKFAERYDLKFPLLSDSEHKVTKQYGAWRPKKVMGREILGAARMTFLIDPDGRVAYVWPKVKVWGHVEDVEKKLAELRG
jgi:peroxiredoxin Q/BCP